MLENDCQRLSDWKTNGNQSQAGAPLGLLGCPPGTAPLCGCRELPVPGSSPRSLQPSPAAGSAVVGGTRPDVMPNALRDHSILLYDSSSLTRGSLDPLSERGLIPGDFPWTPAWLRVSGSWESALPTVPVAV